MHVPSASLTVPSDGGVRETLEGSPASQSALLLPLCFSPQLSSASCDSGRSTRSLRLRLVLISVRGSRSVVASQAASLSPLVHCVQPTTPNTGCGVLPIPGTLRARPLSRTSRRRRHWLGLPPRWPPFYTWWFALARRILDHWARRAEKSNKGIVAQVTASAKMVRTVCAVGFGHG